MLARRWGPAVVRSAPLTICVLMVVSLAAASMQEPKRSPGDQEVRQYLEAVRRERQEIEQAGSLERLSPSHVREIDVALTRADDALRTNRLDEAHRWAFQARWLLPVPTTAAVPGLKRVLGHPKFRHHSEVLAVVSAPDGSWLASAGRDATIIVWHPEGGRLLRVLRGHTDAIRALAVSADGKWLASGGADEAIRIWDVQTGKEIRRLKGHSGGTNCLAFRPDSKQLASGGNDQAVALWDLEKEQEPRLLRSDALGVAVVAYHPKQPLLVSGGNEGTLMFWNTRNGTVLGRWPLRTAIYALAYDPEGKVLAVAGEERSERGETSVIRLLAGESGELRRRLPGHTGSVTALAFSRDGKYLASGGSKQDCLVKVWDLESGLVVRTFQGHADEVRGLTFLPHGRYLISASSDQTLRLWEVEREDQMRELERQPLALWAVAFSPDGKWLATAGADRVVRLYDRATRRLARQLTGHAGPVTTLAFRPDSGQLASGGGDKVVRLWQLDGRSEGVLTGHTAPITAVVYTPSGQVVSAAADKLVKVWNQEGKAELTLTLPSPVLTAVDVSADGALLAAAAEQVVHVWQLPAGTPLRTLHGQNSGTISALAFAPLGPNLATTSTDGEVVLWDAQSGRLRRKLRLSAASLSGLSCDPSGRLLAVAGADASVRLLDAQLGIEIQTLRGHRGWVTAAAFSPDGREVAAVSVDGQTCVWELAVGAVTPEFGHQRAVHALAIHPDGRWLASAGDDRTIRLWDTKDGSELGQLHGHFDSVKALAFSADGELLASASDDLSLRLWDLKARREVRRSTPPGRSEPVLGFFANGQRLVSWSDRSAHVWHTTNGQLDATIVGHDHPLSCFALARDGQLAAFGAGEYGIRIWHLSERRQIADLKETSSSMPEPVQDIAFLPDGKQLIAVDVKGQFQIWDLAEQKVLHRWSGPEAIVVALAVNAKGNRLYACSTDQYLRLYELPHGKMIKELKLDVPVLSLVVHPTQPLVYTANQNGTIYVLEP